MSGEPSWFRHYRASLWCTTALMVILRLTGVIDWHWAWVLSPMIATLSVVVLLYALSGVMAALYGVLMLVGRRRRHARKEGRWR